MLLAVALSKDNYKYECFTSQTHYELGLSMKSSKKVQTQSKMVSLKRTELVLSIRMGVFSDYFAQTKLGPTYCCIG